MAERKNERAIDESVLQETMAHLDSVESSEEGLAYLENRKLDKAHLSALLTQLNIPYSSKDTKEKLIKLIVNSTVGTKRRFEILRHFSLTK